MIKVSGGYPFSRVERLYINGKGTKTFSGPGMIIILFNYNAGYLSKVDGITIEQNYLGQSSDVEGFCGYSNPIYFKSSIVIGNSQGVLEGLVYYY